MIAAALLFAADKSPQKSLFGFRYYTILTPSMAPTYQVGDMVFVKLANADTINVGDVITFNPSSESDAYLTHRVAEKIDNYEGTGVTCFRTKGDANNAEDSFLIDENRVIGAVNFYIPKMGYVFRFVQLRWYFVIALVILIGVLLHLLKLYFAPAQENEEEESETKPETMPSTAQK
ncbi:MAG: signal peptidase I [Ruminococcus sp.]|nr:signal peptidase I [Ruminococcus sp.]